MSIPVFAGAAGDPNAWWECPSDPMDPSPAAEPEPTVEETPLKAPTLPSTQALPRQFSVVEDETPLALDPIGIGSLCLGSTALLCATVSWLCVFLVPLSLLGLVAGVASLQRVARCRQVRPAIPVAGTVVSAAVLLLGLALPSLLGPTYGAYKNPGPPPLRSFANPATVTS